MAKKFKDLKQGDVVYYFDKMQIGDGFQELIMTSDFKYNEIWDEYSADTDACKCISVTEKNFGKSVVAYRYVIWASSLEALQKASQKYIQKELDSIQKQIDKLAQNMKFYEERKENISKFLLQ